MNTNDLQQILTKHKEWVYSAHVKGTRANLQGADLQGVNLQGADLRCADLQGANLRAANLRAANLQGANLQGAILQGVNLRAADLQGANLQCANLQAANLRCADLQAANLRCADLQGADVSCTLLPPLTFTIQGDYYCIQITHGEYIRVGCQEHTVEAWRGFTKADIAEMDGRTALSFYPRLLDYIDFYLGKGDRPEWVKKKDTFDAS